MINYLKCNVTEFCKISLLIQLLDTHYGKVFMTKCQRIQIASYNDYRKLSFVAESVGLSRVRMGVVPFLVLALFLLVLSAETKKNGGKLKEFKTCVSGFCLPKNYRFLHFVNLINLFLMCSSLELPNPDKTHVNMDLEVLDILKVSIFQLKGIPSPISV